ncbi:cell wall protein RBR3 isoform X2 [Xiphias gladius]|uniref:cell wall protein RBR3 isoform X2 n=1 Tax=Xiphias gladius TaxID=8245 RepID=UPI001A98BF6E|nr:cell wall protein RBR3 isoform X2 [Xiphias gladius]
MSSEVCPFCGKTYKRLKSHLPHCKAAANSKTPPTEHRVKTNQATSSSQLVAGSPEPTAKGKKSSQTLSVAASPQSKKSTKVSAVSAAAPRSSSPATPSKSANTSSLSQSLSPSSTPLPPSAKKKKQKLSEQIKMASSPSSPTTSLISSPALSPSPRPTIPKPKKMSLRALIEAAKSDRVTKGSREETGSASGGLPSGSTQFLTDPLRPRSTAQTETNIIPENASFLSLSTDTKLKDAPKKKVSKTKKAAQSLSRTKDTHSDSLASEIYESSARPHARDNFWVDNKGEVEDISVNEMFLKSGSGHQAKITIQDVKATLGRAKTTSQSSGASVLSRVETTDNLSSKARLDTSLSPVTVPAENRKDVAVSCLVTTKTLLSDQLPGTSSEDTEKKGSESKQASLIPLQHGGSSQTQLNFPATPLLSGHLSSRVSQATPLPHTVSVTETLKMGRHVTEPLSISPSPIQLPGPHLSPLVPQTLPARVETLRADDGLKLENRKQNTAHNQSEGWRWYYRRYIDVKKGGVGGLGMLLAGYCVLSYTWSYPHIKRDRWRKYH